MSDTAEANPHESSDHESNHQEEQNDDGQAEQTESKPESTVDSVTLHVGNLSYQTTSENLTKAFSEYGNVISSRIIKRVSGTSKGFGFVEMDTRESGQKAIDALNGHEIDGRAIKIEFAKGKPIDPEERRNNERRRRESRGRYDRYDRSDRYERYDRYERSRFDRDPYRRRDDRFRERSRRRPYDDSPPRRSRSRYSDSASD